MRLTAILLTVALVHARASGSAQTVSLSGKQLTIMQIFSAVEKQTGYAVLLDKELLAGKKSIALSVNDLPLKEFLTMVASDLSLDWDIQDKTIFITRKAPTVSFGRLESAYVDAFPITGTVRADDGSSLPGASLRIKGTKKGTFSDAKGNFSLEASKGDVIIITFTGYEEREVKVESAESLDIVLRLSVASLDEVVVNKGYYNEKQRLSTGNVVRVESKDIERQPVIAPLQALQGRVAGLEITAQSGAAGLAPKVRIRGENSLRTSTGGYPLYIVDGVMIDATPLSSQSTMYFYGYDPLATINPANIESIEVLKDADATAIYGSKGANGVILIRTKQNFRKGRDFEVSAYHGVGMMPRFVDVLDTKEYLTMRREAYRNAGIPPSEYDFPLNYWDTTRNTDWQKEFLSGTSGVTDVQAVLSGGNDRTSFRLNGTFHKESMLALDDMAFVKSGGAFDLNHRSEDNRFTFSFTASYSMTTNNHVNSNQLAQEALNLPPNAPPLYKENGELEWGIVTIGNTPIASFSNPLGPLKNTNIAKIGTLVTNSTINYELFKGFSARLSIGYTDANGDEIVRQKISAFPPTSIGPWSTGRAQFGINRRTSWIVEPQLNYVKEIGDHQINALVGATLQQSFSKWQAISADGYKSDALLGSLKGASNYYISTDESSLYRYIAAFARLGYNWKEKYLVNLTGRRDGSSRFGPGNQFGDFGAIGAAWIISREPFMAPLSNAISFAKLRGSYGITGNDLIGDYQYYSLFAITGYKYQDNVTLKPDNLFNPNFNWEVTKKFEMALELSFLKDRLSLNTSWYRNRASNQLIRYPLPKTTGFEAIQENFNATVENRGWEFVLQSQNVRKRKFNWTTSLNITIPRNELISFPGIATSPYAETYKVGEPLSIRYEYTWVGVDPNTGMHVLQDLNNDGEIDNRDMRFTSSRDAKIYGGLNNTFRIGAFDLSVLLQFSSRKQEGQYPYHPGMAVNNVAAPVMTRWQKPGDITRFAKFLADFNYMQDYLNVANSTYSTVDGSYIKLRTLSASYTMPAKLLHTLRLKSASIYLQGQNLLTFDNYIGFDPETGYSLMPQLRMITAGIQVKI